MPALSASLRTVATSHAASAFSVPSTVCAPVDIFAIIFEMRSEMNAPPKPMMPEKIASIGTLRPLPAR